MTGKTYYDGEMITREEAARRRASAAVDQVPPGVVVLQVEPGAQVWADGLASFCNTRRLPVNQRVKEAFFKVAGCSVVDEQDSLWMPFKSAFAPVMRVPGVRVYRPGAALSVPVVQSANGNIPEVDKADLDELWKFVLGRAGDIATYGLSGDSSEDEESEPVVAIPAVELISADDPDGGMAGVPILHAEAAPPAAEAEDIPVSVVEPVITDHTIDETLTDGEVVRTLRELAAIIPGGVAEDLTDPAEARAILKQAVRMPEVVAHYQAVARQHSADLQARQARYKTDEREDLPLPEVAAVPAAYQCTDDGNAARLLDQYGSSLLFCDAFNAWYIWDGLRWRRDETRQILALAKRVARTIYLEAAESWGDTSERLGKWAVRSGQVARVKAMVEMASSDVAVVPDDLDAHPTLLNCRNCTLDLETLTPRPARREDRLTKAAGVEYDPTAACPRWLDHLNLIFAGDEAVIDGFQQMCGYSLLGLNPEEVMFILYGRGKNGKSVTTKVLSHVLGDYAVNLAAESLMVKRGDAIRSDLVRLRGARLATATETEDGAKLAESVVKSMTSSNDTITARGLYEREVEFTPTAKIWLCTNHEPQIRGTDDGIWRRIWLLPFTVQITEEQRDTGIVEKLIAEGPGILNWMIKGLEKYAENGRRLRPPDKVIAATRKYRRESDALTRCLADNLMFGDTARNRTIARKELTAGLKKWFEEENEPLPSPKKIAAALRERGVTDGPVMQGTRYWIHLRWKTDQEREDDGIEQGAGGA